MIFLYRFMVYDLIQNIVISIESVNAQLNRSMSNLGLLLKVYSCEFTCSILFHVDMKEQK